jgi:1-acyl-sn-glycerol-3-phosphate acyltransferase
MVLRTGFHLLVLRPLLRFLFGLHVQGGEQLRELKQFVIVANHNSHLDALLLMSVLPWRAIPRSHPVAAADHFGRSALLARWMERLLAPVWVDRARAPGAALEEMGRCLDAGDNLLLFPEGSRGEPGQLGPFKSGIGRLLQRRPDVPVIPAHILGPERALPRGAAVPLPVWNRVVLGPARRLRGEPRDVTAELRNSVDELANAERSRRHQRRLRRRSTFTVAVLGVDGSGKSTLARNLAAALSESGSAAMIGDRWKLYSEGAPRNLQPMIAEYLRRRLSRHAKAAATLTAYKIPKLAELFLRDALLASSRRWYDPDWVVMDGSPLMNITAWSILYEEHGFDQQFCERALAILAGRDRVRSRDPLRRRFPELRWLQRLSLTRLAVPDAVIVLNIEAEVAMARIAARDEAQQAHETEDKLRKLGRAYEAVCAAAERLWNLPVLRLQATGSREDLAAAAQAFVAPLRRAQHDGA